MLCETAGEYRVRALRHRPTDPALLAAEIHRLAAGGWTARDIATALRLDVVAVLQILRAARSTITR